MAPLDFHRDGAQLFHGAAIGCLDELFEAFAGLPADRAGIRLNQLDQLRPQLTNSGPVGSIAASTIGTSCRPVRAILFDKTPDTNWSLGWHQDRTICVKQRIDVEGFGPWTMKAGMQHVAPPFELLARMVTLRVHLDDVPRENAPLLIAPGSHHQGSVPESSIEQVVNDCGTYACLAEKGDIWLYATPILHASESSTICNRRRVLQLDFSADELTGGLEWMAV